MLMSMAHVCMLHCIGLLTELYRYLYNGDNTSPQYEVPVKVHEFSAEKQTNTDDTEPIQQNRESSQSIIVESGAYITIL